MSAKTDRFLLDTLLECSLYLQLANHAALEACRDDIAQDLRKTAWKVDAAIATLQHAAEEVAS